MRIVLQPALAGRKTVKMKTKRNERQSPEQIFAKIQQADRILAEGGDVAAVLKERNVTQATYYRWGNHYGGLKAEDQKKLKQLEKQNVQLTKLLAEAELQKAVFKQLAEGNF